jgi:hypothetical protein
MMTGTLGRVLVVRAECHSHVQFIVLGRIITMSTSAADLIGTCACAQDVQFKFRSKKMHLFSRWMFISDRDRIINLHQVPTSQQAADIDENRPMALPWSVFSFLRRPHQHRLRSGLSLPTLLLYSACLNDIGHECEFRKHDCLMHVGMVVLKACDDGTRM